eukprot:sb/3474115/
MLSALILVGLLLAPTKGNSVNVTFQSATAYDTFNANTPDHVIDGLLTTKYHSDHDDNNKWLELKLATPRFVKKVFILNDGRDKPDTRSRLIGTKVLLISSEDPDSVTVCGSIDTLQPADLELSTNIADQIYTLSCPSTEKTG